MNKQQDYVMAENANVLGEKSLSDSVKGIFIGTKNYFFFIPVNAIEVQHRGRKHKQTKVAYFYKGEPVNSFISEYVNERGLSVSAFEDFVVKKLKKAIPEVRICPITEIQQFKVYANWWGSGILINDSPGKTGWKPFVSRFKGAKKEIKDFYQGQPKLYGK